jgi:sulfur-oxidizing protein SoxX
VLVGRRESLALLVIVGVAGIAPASAQRIEGDAMPEALTGVAGDPDRGRRVVADRRTGMCLLCHPAPIPEERFQGDLAPDLAGVGARLTEGQLRLRIVDSRRVFPESIMPAFHRVTGLERVAREREGKPVLDAQQVEDVVAWLQTLK